MGGGDVSKDNGEPLQLERNYCEVKDHVWDHGKSLRVYHINVSYNLTVIFPSWASIPSLCHSLFYSQILISKDTSLLDQSYWDYPLQMLPGDTEVRLTWEFTNLAAVGFPHVTKKVLKITPLSGTETISFLPLFVLFQSIWSPSENSFNIQRVLCGSFLVMRFPGMGQGG